MKQNIQKFSLVAAVAASVFGALVSFPYAATVAFAVLWVNINVAVVYMALGVLAYMAAMVFMWRAYVTRSYMTALSVSAAILIASALCL